MKPIHWKTLEHADVARRVDFVLEIGCEYKSDKSLHFIAVGLSVSEEGN